MRRKLSTYPEVIVMAPGNVVRYNDTRCTAHAAQVVGIVLRVHGDHVLVQCANHPDGPKASTKEVPMTHVELAIT